MKKILFLLPAIFIAGGCAHAPSFGVPDDRVEVVDQRKIDIIQDYAQRSGVTVLWIRKPTKLVAKADAL